MTSKELNLKLVKEIPEIYELYKKEVIWQEGDNTGSHTVFGDILTPYLKTVIKNKDENMVNKILDFIEKILEKNDEYSTEVISFSVLESLLFDDEIKNCWSMLGEKSKKICEEINDWRNKNNK